MKRIFLLLITISTFFGCTDDGSGGGPTYDRTDLLINWSDNIIIPAYQSFNTEVDAIKTATTAFTTSPSEANLTTLRTAWETAYKSWQHVSMFEIGKAEELDYRQYMNTYPVNTTEVDDNISSGTYNLALPSLFDAQGFPALDYLLYGLASTDADILAFYTTNAKATNYKTYLSDLVNRMDDLSGQVLSDWQTTYRDIFVANTGSSSTASLDRLANDYILYYESVLRNGKIDIPAGLRSGNTPLPDKVEAFYKKDISRDLLVEALTASKNFYEGKHFGSTTTGESFKSYLVYLNTISDNENLAAEISTRFDDAILKAGTLDNSFVDQIADNNTLMLETRDKIQRVVSMIKTDMFSAMDISVDFIDADGD